MQYRFLGKTGLRVSELCLGAMTFGREAIEADSFINSVECISKPLNGATAPLNLADWLQKVTAASSTAESEFNAGNWGTFRDQCQEIRKLVFGMLSKRNLLLESEIGDLRSFSRALKDKF